MVKTFLISNISQQIFNISNSILFFSYFLFFSPKAFSQDDYYKQNRTLTYAEVISAYKQLDIKYPQAKMIEFGKADGGKPLHLFLISANGNFNRDQLRKNNGCFLLINNGIHPGEPDGIDASLLLAKDLLNKKISIPENVMIGIIPVYNIDGALNRGCCSRMNQDGPVEYGFRGNARNLDLNRDFIKCDSENAKAFNKMFTTYDPDVFVDTHTSNGADYAYTMTLIATQKDKLNHHVADFMQQEFLPALYTNMQKLNFLMSPYVDTFSESPERGINGFLETPRYATGYAALFNSLAFTTETHMLKPFAQRVEATYTFLNIILDLTSSSCSKILKARADAKLDCATNTKFDIQWKQDTTHVDSIWFDGYAAKHKKSEVTGLDRLYYDRNSPYHLQIPYYNNFQPSLTIDKPSGYIIPQAWKEVIERLQMNGVKMQQFQQDTMMNVEVYYIRDYKSRDHPYEGHYLHTDVKTEKENQTIKFYKGDYIVICNQTCNRYIIETLEPQAVDSYFAWNFFDSVLQQKEWFSDYVFEEKAEEILKNDDTLKKDFEQRKLQDSSFANNHWMMLNYIYQHSSYYEKTHNRYPVCRVIK